MEHGADIHENDEQALRISSENGHLELVKYLVEKGADIHAIDDYAYRMAVSNKRSKSIWVFDRARC